VSDYERPRGHDLPPEVCHMDGNEASQNYLRQSWPLDGSAASQADFIAGAHGTPQARAQQLVNQLMQNWIGQWLPDDVKAELERRGLVVPPARYGKKSRAQG
jgi:hypothetical protein